MPQRLASVLAERLSEVGFAPEHLLAELVFARVHRRGRLEASQLPPEFEEVERLWPSITYLLGMGASLTEFLTAGVAADGALRGQMASLGGVANAMYGLCDWLLDTGHGVPKLFQDAPQCASERPPRTHQQLIVSLLNFYTRELWRLSSSKPEIAELTLRALKKLYVAEMQSTATSGITRSAWWRKSALPVFVIALPGWISSEAGRRISIAEHLRWLGKTGELIGWVDDFADYEDDCASGDANRLKALDRDSILRVATKVAEQGRQVLRDWDLHNEHVAARNTFLVMIWSWLTVDPQNKGPEAHAGSGL